MKRLSANRLAVLCLAVMALTSTGASAAEEGLYPSIRPFGYMQYRGAFGAAATPHQFSFDRVRLGMKGRINKHIGYRVMVELLKLDKPTKANTTVEGLLDARLTYTVMPALKISAGQFKTPFSMAYNTSASKLDVIGFGMSTNIALNRGLGLMVSGRNLADTGIGYGIGVFNAGTRADGTAFTAGVLGHDDMFAGRLLFDGFNKALHVEGGAAHATVSGGSVYAAAYSALRLRYEPVELKAEWLKGKQGSRSTTVVYAQLLVTVIPQVELVAKWERTRFSDAATRWIADNLILGLNAAIYPEKPQRARLQLNYVVASRDAGKLGAPVGFKKGFKDNQFILLLQAGY